MRMDMMVELCSGHYDRGLLGWLCLAVKSQPAFDELGVGDGLELAGILLDELVSEHVRDGA